MTPQATGHPNPQLLTGQRKTADAAPAGSGLRPVPGPGTVSGTDTETETGTETGTGTGGAGCYAAPGIAPTRATEPELLVAASLLLADAALAARQAGAELTGALSSWRSGMRALRDPAWALGSVLSCARALTSPQGLGFGANGGVAGELARVAGNVTRRRPAAVAMAVDAFALRIAAAAATHPNLDTPCARRLTDALVRGDRLEALRALFALVERLGVTRALTTVSPVIMELLALTGLLDENPVNDGFSWVTLAGGVPATDPFLGLPSSLLGLLNPGPGRAERAEADPILASVLAGSANDIVSYVNDIGALGNHGLVLLRRVACADGAVRYVLLLPGTSFGLLSNSTPQDVIGAFDGLLRTDTTYTRAVKALLARAGVPAGAELMLVGHSLGGLTAMNLASDVTVASEYRITHVVALGSPIDAKRPADHTTRVISLVNEHDVIPTLDGRGPASPNDVPEHWLELAWLDATYDYPLSHAPQAYSDSLRGPQAPLREEVNALLTAYDGDITANQPYMLRDK
ncbi:hypothetical protein ACFWBI_19455 [Streptomyces sp. NPDC059982]|uniref:lipase family protein n=1 Tax=unclassified Streptomyces TaxID=2593676 RepID=UPI0036850377